MDTSDSPWIFDKGELPRWATLESNQTKPTFDFGIGIPAITPEPFWPLFGRLLLLRLGIAVGFPVVVAIGAHYSKTSSLFGMLVGSCLIGFLLALVIYLWTLSSRHRAQQQGALHPHPIPDPPSAYWLVIFPIFLPLALLLVRCIFFAFEARFFGVLLAAVACLALYYWRGDRPILFTQELLLAGVSVPPQVTRTRIRFPGYPDLAKMAIVLLIVLLVPAYLSNSWGILAAIVLCGLEVRRSFVPLLRFGPWQTILAALWIRATKVLFEYLDYAPQDVYHWRSPEPLARRRLTLMALLGSFDFVMLTGLAYYCPWEPFAAMFVPDFKSNFLLLSDYAQSDYRWLRAPLQLVSQAQPMSGYLVCYLFAIVFFFVLPTVVLFLIYIERLAELEILAQELKRPQLG